MANIQQQPAAPQAVDAPEDPQFEWTAPRLPLETPFPLPHTGIVQRIAAGLYAKVHNNVLTGRDQHEARFAFDMLADWEDMDQELRTRVFQRINLYAIVATHGWPTAIAATTVSKNSLNCFLPPGVQPIIQQPRQNQFGGRRRNQPAQAATVPPQRRLQRLQLNGAEDEKDVAKTLIKY